MPRKVTKTIREARKRAAELKRKRNAYRAKCSETDYQWGAGGAENNIHTNRRSTQPEMATVTVTKERKSPENLVLDLNSIEQRVNIAGTQTGRFKGKVQSDLMTEEEYAAREAAAQEEIERKKNCIAPAYNKGAYQYIASEEQAKDAGKK